MSSINPECKNGSPLLLTAALQAMTNLLQFLLAGEKKFMQRRIMTTPQGLNCNTYYDPLKDTVNIVTINSCHL